VRSAHGRSRYHTRNSASSHNHTGKTGDGYALASKGQDWTDKQRAHIRRLEPATLRMGNGVRCSRPWRNPGTHQIGRADRKAEEEYGKHVEYFYHKLLRLRTGYISPPGNADYKSPLNILMSGKDLLQFGDLSIELKPLKAKDMIEKEFVVIGSPATVREKLKAMAKRLNVGHLMVALQFGCMPHGQAKKNIELFGREILPHLQRLWEDQNWENLWWPKRLRKRLARQREKATV
jgi:alkanesulfonate monooxygenase SsuD/methylene tetrahydromethanopterin reductase-like flavin-dependent oxidoreductase (luciferase family)